MPLPTQPSRRPVRPYAKALSAAAALVAGGLVVGVVGCDKPADQAVRQGLTAAYASRGGGDPDRKYVQNAAKLAADSNGGDFPPAAAALAQELQGDVSAESADALLGGGAMKPDDPNFAAGGLLQAQTDALALAGQANQLAEAIALGTTYIAGQQASDPQPTLSLITQRIAAVRTGDGWKPVPDVTTALASLAQTDAELESIQSKISQLESRNGELDSKRSDLLGQASTLDEQSRQQGGRQGVETYRRVSDLRNEASGLVAEQTTVGGQLLVARQDLAEQQALKASLTDAVAALQKQQETLQSAWQGVQGQITNLRQANDATYAGGGSGGTGGTGGTGGESIESLGQRLADVVRRMEDQRREAVRLLGDADSAYTKAVERSGKASQAASNDPDKALSKAIRDAFDTKRILLKQAVAKRQLGQVQASSAKVYATLLRLQETLKAAGRDLPKALDVNPQEQYVSAVSAAAEAFDAANTQMSNVTDSATGPLQAAAITQKAVLLSGMTGLSNLIEIAGVQAQSNLPSKAELQSQIGQVSEAAKTANVTLPPLNGFAASAGAAGESSSSPQAEAEPGDFADAGPEEQAARQTLNEYLSAVQAGDKTKAKSLSLVAPGAEGDDELIFDLYYQSGRLRDALEKQFGAEAAQMTGAIDRQFGKLRPQQLVIRDDGAYAPQSDEPDDPMLKKDAGQWKLYFEPPVDAQEQATKAQLPALVDILKTAADDVEAGTYATVQAYQQAVIPKLQAASGAGAGGQ